MGQRVGEHLWDPTVSIPTLQKPFYSTPKEGQILGTPPFRAQIPPAALVPLVPPLLLLSFPRSVPFPLPYVNFPPEHQVLYK